MLSWQIVHTILRESREYNFTPTERHVLATLLSHCNNKTGCMFPSVNTLAEETGRSRRTVQRCLRSLEAQGRIKVRRNPRGWGSNFYQLTIPGIECPPSPHVNGVPHPQPYSSFRSCVKVSPQPAKGKKKENLARDISREEQRPPSLPPRPDNLLYRLDSSTFTRLETQARTCLQAEGVKPFAMIQPVIQSRMIVLLYEQQEPPEETGIKTAG